MVDEVEDSENESAGVEVVDTFHAEVRERPNNEIGARERDHR